MDCDGPLADWIGGVLRLQSFGNVKRDDIDGWDVVAALDLRDQGAAREALDDPDWWRTLPVEPGAQEAIDCLRHCHEIIVVTSWWSVRHSHGWRPLLGWMDARFAWLEEHFRQPGDLVFPVRKKRYVHGDAFIDDRPSYVHRWRAYQMTQARARVPETFLYGTPSNVDVPTEPRHTWGTIREHFGV